MKKRITAISIAVVLVLIVAVSGVSVFASNNYPEAIESDYVNTGNARFDIAQHALSQVGYYEGRNNWTVFGYEYGNPSGAWCVYFVQWCADKANISSTVLPESRYGRVADYWENAISNEFEFHPVNDFENPYIPKQGDLVIYRKTYTYYDRSTGEVSMTETPNSVRCQVGKNGDKRMSHIGIVSSDATVPTNNGSSVNNASFNIVDGNWNNKVASRSENYKDITGFVSLKYPASEYGNIGEWPILSYGSTGSNVTILQAILRNIIGAEIDMDGEFGSETLAAVKRFQKQYDLEIDGMVGPKTWTKLIRFCQSKNSYNWSSTMVIQMTLRNKFSMELDVDGCFGSETYKAVCSLQREFGIAQDGVVGPETWRVIICGRSS